MSDLGSPAGSTGGPVTVPTLDDLPEKLRVHALARLIGRTSKEVLAALAELGVEARSAQSSVVRKDAEQVVTALLPDAGPPADAGPGEAPAPAVEAPAAEAPAAEAPAVEAPAPAGRRTRSRSRTAVTPVFGAAGPDRADAPAAEPAAAEEAPAATDAGAAALAPVFAPAAPLFQAPAAPRTRRRSRKADAAESVDGTDGTDGADGTDGGPAGDAAADGVEPVGSVDVGDTADTAVADAAAGEDATDAEQDGGDAGADDDDVDGGGRRRRRRGRRGRGRGRGADDTGEDGDESTDGTEGTDSADGAEDTDGTDESDADEGAEDTDEDESGDSGASRRRRRRRRRRGSGDDDENGAGDPPNTVTKVRTPRERDGRDARDTDDDGVQSVRGSTRLEAKRQRRRDGRDAGRRRVPILSEAEFLARRESVDRAMVVRERGDRVEIAVLEDDVLVEHFVTGGPDGSGNGAGKSIVGNIYLGRVQNVLPSMEAAFVDIGRGRNAVLYAGEVDWDAAGLGGKARRIEQALSSGDSVLVQVTKDPLGHKGARLTTQISLAGRFLVYVPSGGAAGISRKLPDVERKRLKDMLKEIVPSEAGVIIRTASEGVSHEALERDVRRLQAQWEVVKGKAEATGPSRPKAPSLLYEEPDMLIKVVRDQFNEDFSTLVVAGDDAWDTVAGYVGHVAPELAERLHRHVGPSDVFADHRIDEQLLKALDRKVWLPSGGTLVIDRTEAMTVIDVNTGKFTGSGGNLEETVTRNNLEAAEEVVRQLRLRDIGGIIVVDFIDMVLEANRDLVLRRLTECLARDRTRHQVAEVTSLGLVQMTRKRVGGGLLEHFSTTCEHCRGRGVIVNTEPAAERVESARGPEREGRRSRGGRRRGGDDGRAENGRNGRSGEQGPDGGSSAGRGSTGRDEAAGPVDGAAPVPEPVAALATAPAVDDPAASPGTASTAVPTTEPGAGPTGGPAAVASAPAALEDPADDPGPAGDAEPVEVTADGTDGAADGTDAAAEGTQDGPDEAGGAAGADSAAEVAVAVSDTPAFDSATAPGGFRANGSSRSLDNGHGNAHGNGHPNGSSPTTSLPSGGPAAPEPDEAPAPRPRRRAVRRTAGAPSGEAAVAVVTVAAGTGSADAAGPDAPGPDAAGPDAPGAGGAEPDRQPAGEAATVPAGVVPQPEPTATSRPRRTRRAASRPAGPPVADGEQGADQTADQNTGRIADQAVAPAGGDPV